MSLVFNIFTNVIGGHFISYTSNKITAVPQLMLPKLLPQFGIPLKYFPVRNTFHNLDYFRWRIPWWCFDKHMDMVFQHFHSIYVKLVFFSYLLKYFFHIAPYLGIKDMFSILRHPYQMIFQIVNCVFCTSNSLSVCYNSYGITLARALITLRLGCFHTASKLTGIQWRFL